eukprot:Tamp_14938.p1 GENE.Tamp_14938~~Tamp_14938.p1  ORF type:complete len:458 (+),score=77.41 Tamp_14938:158-1531(+)
MESDSIAAKLRPSPRQSLRSASHASALIFSLLFALSFLVEPCQSLPEHYGVDANGLPAPPLKVRLQRYIRSKFAVGKPGALGAHPEHGAGLAATPDALRPEKQLAAAKSQDHAHSHFARVEEDAVNDAKTRMLIETAVRLSLGVNICLFIAKIFAASASGSRAVLATMLDSFVDLMSQMVIFFAEWSMKTHDPDYPVGKSRLETVGVIVSAGIMSFSALTVLQTAMEDIISSQHLVTMETSTYLILGAATLSKLLLFFLCSALKEKSASALALAEDHFNDILSNSGAMATAAAASRFPQYWYIDPIGGGVIALYIIVSWFNIARTHIDKIVGKSAPPEFIQEVHAVTTAHHHALKFDACRAYYFGQNYLVELEVMLPPTMTVHESHDIALDLQHKIEAMEGVERCFVHVDYRSRAQEPPEHKVERELIAECEEKTHLHRRGCAGEFKERNKFLLQPK